MRNRPWGIGEHWEIALEKGGKKRYHCSSAHQCTPRMTGKRWQQKEKGDFVRKKTLSGRRARRHLEKSPVFAAVLHVSPNDAKKPFNCLFLSKKE